MARPTNPAPSKLAPASQTTLPMHDRRKSLWDGEGRGGEVGAGTDEARLRLEALLQANRDAEAEAKDAWLPAVEICIKRGALRPYAEFRVSGRVYSCPDLQILPADLFDDSLLRRYRWQKLEPPVLVKLGTVPTVTGRHVIAIQDDGILRKYVPPDGGAPETEEVIS